MEYKSANSQIFKYPIRKLWGTLILSLFISCTVHAQQLSTQSKKASKSFEKAQEFYQQHNYKESKEELAEALEEDPKFVEALTMRAYIALDEVDYTLAKDLFTRAVNSNPNLIPNNLYFLGKLEFSEGEYAKAQSHLNSFLETNPSNRNQVDESRNTLDKIEFALRAKNNPVPFEPKNLGPEINSEHAEYFPCLTVDSKTILFTRRLPAPNTPAGFNEDFYISNQSSEQWQTAVNLGTPINSPMNEGAPSLSADGQLLIFTACELYGDYGSNRKGAGSCDLFYTTKEGERWSIPLNLGLTINSRNWETQPSFSSDGKTLYFVRGKRDRTGNRTGDIYMTKIQDDNTWSEPIMLNANINTRGNEESVFIHPDGKTLYFSSDGHLGMGGLDIYMSRKDENGDWGPAVNLGYPINTHKNENSLLIDASGELAYFASDREQGYGDLDLYSFELAEAYRPNPVTYFKGKIYDEETNNPLAAKFELINLETEEVVVESYSDPVNGTFLISLPSGGNFALNASKKGYLFYSDNFALKNNANNEAFQKNVPMQPIKQGGKIVLKNIFFETAKYDLKQDSKAELNKLVDFLNNNPSLVVEVGGHTDNVGSDQSNQVLSQNRAQSVVDYLKSKGITADRIKAKGYGSNNPISTNETAQGRSQNRRTEFKILEL